MLKCIAIDDEELGLELLVDNIRKVPFLELSGSFSHPLEALPFLEKNQVDLVFLDIQMPGLTGLQFIRTVPKSSMFILVTAYEKYALEGYDLNVVDYLVKPVEMSRFIQACQKALSLHQLRLDAGVSRDDTRDEFLFVNVEYSLVRIEKNDIRWIESLKDYIRIHLFSTPKPIVTRMSMKQMEEQLPPASFVRIHKSYIIAIRAIHSIRKTTVMLGDAELPIGDNYKESFYQRIGRTE